MTADLHSYLPSLGELAGLAALLAVVLGFAAIGAVVALFTLVGWSRAVPFGWIALAALALALAAVVRLLRLRRPPVSPALLRTLLVSAPLVLLVAAMEPSQWDEFTNWLPNARFLVEHDSFPGPGLPRNPSVFPAYPYALPLVAYLASRLTGYLVENAVALFNLVLLLTLGALVARVMRDAVAAGRAEAAAGGAPSPLGWGWCALGALMATMLNPTFVHKIAFTAYADTGTAVALGFAAALGWKALNALAGDRPDEARSLAWQIGLAATALVAIKQVNLVLLAALAAAMALVALRDARVSLGGLLRLAPGALALPVVVYVAWRLYVAANITGGEFVIRPMDEWHISLIPDALARMALIASKKGGYFAVMLIALAFGLRALWRTRTEFDRLALIAAGVFLAYNAFLLFAYIAAFGEHDARVAASYWRYNMHLGGVCVLFAGYGGALLWRRFAAPRMRRRLGPVAVALTLALPIALISKLRFDLHPRYIYARETALEIAALLRPADRLVLVDPEGNGQYLVIMRYHMHGSAQVAAEVTAFAQATAATLSDIVESSRATGIWVYRPRPLIEAALGVRLAPGASYLLRRTKGGWTAARSWPHPG